MGDTVRSLVRASAAWMLGAYTHTPPMTIAKRQWIADKGAEWLCRAPTDITDTVSAPDLIRTVVPDFIATLAPASAAVRILQAGLQLTFGRAGKIAVPTIHGDPSYARFVKEGSPIPVVQGFVEPPVELTPKGLASIVVLTGEMIKSSNIEVLIKDALTRSTALAMDQVMLDDQPGDDVRPPGLRYGLTPLAASPAPLADDAMALDLAALQDAIADMPAPPLFIMSPARALTAQLRSHGLVNAVASPALNGTSDVIAVAPGIVASVLGGEAPKFFASREAAVQMDDQPLDDGTLGPATASMWQTDSVALRLQWPVTWGVRSATMPAPAVGVAWLTATNW